MHITLLRCFSLSLSLNAYIQAKNNYTYTERTISEMHLLVVKLDLMHMITTASRIDQTQVLVLTWHVAGMRIIIHEPNHFACSKLNVLQDQNPNES